jgi:hypothetical protein
MEVRSVNVTCDRHAADNTVANGAASRGALADSLAHLRQHALALIVTGAPGRHVCLSPDRVGALGFGAGGQLQ